MTSLLQPQTIGSCKKLEPISVHRTKTLKKQGQPFESMFNLHTKTKDVFRNKACKMQISTFDLSDDTVRARRPRDNDFSHIDLVKDGTQLGTSMLGSRTFLDKLQSFGLDGVDRLEDSLLAPPEQILSLKRVKTPPEQPTIHIDPPKDFFAELTPDLLQSRLIPNGPNASIRDNESMMYFFDIKQPSVNKSGVFGRHLSSQVLSPSRVFGERRPFVSERDKLIQFELQEPLVMPDIPLMSRGVTGDREQPVAPCKRSPENCFWVKGEETSPVKGLGGKSSRFEFGWHGE